MKVGGGGIGIRGAGFMITCVGTIIPLVFHEDGGTIVLKIIDMYWTSYSIITPATADI